MVASGFFDRRDAEPNVAEGFDPDEHGRLVQNIFKYPPIGSPDGGAHVTAGDLVRFIEATRAGELLPADLTRLFFTPQVRHDEATEYGFGLSSADATGGSGARTPESAESSSTTASTASTPLSCRTQRTVPGPSW